VSAVAALHPPPFGPFALVCFVVGVEMLARHEHQAAVAPPPVGPTPTPAGV
jgi:hypothetical protein